MAQKVDFSAIRIKTQPAAEPATAAQLRLNLRLDDTTWDSDMLPVLIQAAREAIETATGRTLIDTVYELFYDEWPNDYIELPKGPIDSVTSVKYIDEDGTQQTWDSSKYRTDLYSIPGRIEPAWDESWPSIRTISNTITVEYKCGYGTASTDIPEALRQAVIMLASDMFEHSEANAEKALHANKTVQMLINTYKIPTVY